ncbi:hypothetical protein D6810_02940 [Candidatus Dojkabacteria bacterium]|uniref:Uncharacterized protein n=1 Tax=Candidatus Dojkabacteria bacterium TaxID=2099670 RepID=A0A3M0YYL6_9BACT|nr:MAG: hypothetical protein D6810_02940 [Candidatus Dojkabacteria bacterium]
MTNYNSPRGYGFKKAVEPVDATRQVASKFRRDKKSDKEIKLGAVFRNDILPGREHRLENS